MNSNIPPNIFMFHAGCHDGFLSTVICKIKFSNSQIEYRPINHGSIIDLDAITGKYVMISDFSFSREEFIQICMKAKAVIVFEHHESFGEVFTGWVPPSNMTIHYDPNECGASLVWKFLYPRKQIPKFVELVKRYDLWLDEGDLNKTSHQLDLALDTEKKNFETWAEYLENPDALEEILRRGKEILPMVVSILNKMSEMASWKVLRTKEENFLVAILNTDSYINEFSSKFLKENPQIDFVITYKIDDRKDKIRYNFRGEKGRKSALVFVESLGGKGHQTASDFIRNSEDIPCKLFQMYDGAIFKNISRSLETDWFILSPEYFSELNPEIIKLIKEKFPQRKIKL